ncbi:MAG: hypothetical protein QG656_216, partial [Candidatus Hydrogenedentes bacterium]|nr:hypothetical protein [Candidatus Hydrogenedentota bacterium]
ETFDAAMKPWLDQSARIEQATLLLAHENGDVSVRFALTCTP